MQGMLFFHFDSHKQDTYETWCRGQYKSSSKWLMDSLFLLAGLIDFPLGFTSLSVAGQVGQVVERLDLETLSWWASFEVIKGIYTYSHYIPIILGDSSFFFAMIGTDMKWLKPCSIQMKGLDAAQA